MADLGSVTTMIATVLLVTAVQCSGADAVGVEKVAASPDRDISRPVRIVGLILNGHYGAFLTDEAGEFIVRLRLEENPALPPGTRIRRDALFEQFWDATHVLRGPAVAGPQTIRANIVGIVRVLRNEPGRSDGSFDPRSEGPIEIIPIRVLSLERLTKRVK